MGQVRPQPLNQTVDGHKYVLTFQDELSKYTLAIPIVQQDAMTVARALVEGYFEIWNSTVNTH
jgi:hypothetical protein